MKRMRVELRHMGRVGPRWGAYKIYGWGYNIDLGWYFIAIRRPTALPWRPINMTWRPKKGER